VLEGVVSWQLSVGSERKLDGGDAGVVTDNCQRPCCLIPLELRESEVGELVEDFTS
jgi:hypothetical protein